MLVFFSTRFIVRFSSTRFSALIFRFLIHLDLIFVYGMKRRGPALPRGYVVVIYNFLREKKKTEAISEQSLWLC